MKTLGSLLSTCLVFGLVPRDLVFGGASFGIDTKDRAPATDIARTLPEVRLAPIERYSDEIAQVRQSKAKAEDLAAQSDQSGDALVQANLLLSAVNRCLAIELEPFCTRRLLELAPPPGIDEAVAREALDRAHAWMNKAEALVRAVRNDADDLPAVWVGVQRRASILRAFASAQAAVLLPAEGEGALRDRRQAASLLSPVLEDDDPQVAAAAALWMLYVRRDDEKTGSVLSTAEPLLTPPAKGSLPYAFFSRLRACRLLATDGHPAAATSLLLQLEDRSLDWFTSDAERAGGERAAALVRWAVLESWHERLSAESNETERRWCNNARGRIQRHVFAQGEPTVLRLYPAVPMLVQDGDRGAGDTDRQPE